MKSKHAAMEMSVGTIVTIVLLMTVLILGLVLVKQIFFSGTSAIDNIDRAIQNEINKLFAEEGKKVVVYPPSREISLKKGQSGGFGFSIRNTEMGTETFAYTVTANSMGGGCQMTIPQADDLIILGKEGSNIVLGSGGTLENAILVKFKIPESASLCNIRYIIDVTKTSGPYVSGLSVDLEIK